MRRAALLVLLLGCRSSPAEPDVKPEVTVKVARATLGDVEEKITAPATLFPREKANITSAMTAPIRALRAHKGDRVARGQVLAELENRDVLAQRGEAVAAVRAAQVLRDRRQELYRQGAIPERDLLTAQTELAQATARLERIDAQVRFSELRSPFAGSVTEQFLYAGDMVKPDTPVFTVVDLGTAVARAQVPENEVAGVARGQSAIFSTGTDSVAGKVTMVNQAVDPARRTVEVWCELPNADGKLRDGVFGHVAIVTGRQRRQVLVPAAAVQGSEGAEEATLVVVDGKGVARKREVKVRARGEQVAVEGVAAGETVVVEGGFGLPDGTAVKIAGDAR
jgi:RND family efflux transporter MFP subunit